MNNEEFNIEFFDEKIWAKGDTGETPIVTIDASVDNTVGTPSVDVNKTGDAEHPHFDIDFKHIKGEKGNTGATPNMTINATVNQTIGEASVEVEQTGTPEHPHFDIAFSGVKGEKGDKGDTGYTPNIEVGASVDNTVGTPNVTVSKTGTPENPRLEFDFKHLKGVKGEKGDTGTTPNISMSATVGQSIGTPSVNVSKSGSAENPSFTLAFNNIKGEKGDKGDKGDQGDDGLDGFKNRLTEKTDILPTDCVPINEADGTAKYTTTKNLLADVNDALGRKNWFNPMVNSVTSGLTFNAYDDGVIINGTATSAIYKSAADKELELSKGRYLIKGNAYANDNKFIWLLKFPKNGSWDDRSVVKIIKQDDQELSISESDAEQYYYTPMLTCPKDTTFDNEDWKIILYKLENSEGLDTNLGLNYTVDTLDTTLTRADKTDMGLLGNLIKDQEPQTIENNGITFDVDSNGTITINGTATDTITQMFGGSGIAVSKGDIIVISGAKNYKDSLSRIGSDRYYFNGLNTTSGDTSTWRGAQSTLENRTFEVTADSFLKWAVKINEGNTYNNFKFYPSIHIIGKKEVEIAYTNKELGDRLEVIEEAFSENKDKLTFRNMSNADANELEAQTDNVQRLNAKYFISTCANLPTIGNYRVFTINQTADYATQIAAYVNGNNLYMRSKISGTWGAWEKLITATELAAKKPKWTDVLAVRDITTSATEYECTDIMSGDDKKFLEFSIQILDYENVLNALTVQGDYLYNSKSYNRFIIYNPRQSNLFYEIYKGSDSTHIVVKANRADETTANYKIRIYGITY